MENRLFSATVGRFNSTLLDIVAIDPTKGNVSKLYQLLHLYGLDDGLMVCIRVNSKRNLIHVLVNVDDLRVEIIELPL